MKLSLIQQKVLAAVEFDAPDLAETSRRTGLRVNQVRHALSRLKELQILERRIAVLNHWRLGYSCYSVNLATGSCSRKAREVFLRWLCTADNVCWVSQLAGRFQYSLLLLAHCGKEVVGFLTAINRESGLLMQQKVVSLRTRIWVFPRRYLDERVKGAPISESGEAGTVYQPDALDRRILNALGEQSYDSESALARRLALPQPTLNRRLHALKQAGVIERYVWLINLQALQVLRYKILIMARGSALDLCAALLKFAQESPNVVILAESLGEWDYELSIEAFSLDEVLAVVSALQDRFGEQINRIELLSVLKFGKFSMLPGRL